MRRGIGLDRREAVISLGASLLVGGTSLAPAMAANGTDEPNLAGRWRLATDPSDAGLAGRWFSRRLETPIDLPGSLEANRIGHRVAIDTPWTGDINDRSFYTAPDYARYRQAGDLKVPFFLQPDSWYRGPAWFQRDIEVPASWAERPVELFLERAHWKTSVWIDDAAVGSCDALHVPHRYDCGVLTPGRHRLTIRVDNRMIVEIGHNGHGVTDHTQGNWNGIAGRIQLRVHEPVRIARVDLHPLLDRRTLLVRGRLQRSDTTATVATVDIRCHSRRLRAPVVWDEHGGTFEGVLDFTAGTAAEMAPWDEFTPTTHPVTVRLSNGEQWDGRFGWRTLVADRAGFRLNDRPMMLRGTLECSIFPLSGHPPTELADWQRIMRRIKAYGLNHLRFHSYCPPAAAFDAADAAGVYLQIETVWANQSVRIGSGLPVDRWVYAETDRILAEHGNHPSFILMTHGNEPGGGDPAGEKRRDAFLADYVRHYRQADTRRLWTTGSGWPTIDASQYHVTPTPRVQNWGEELKSRINAAEPETCTDYRAFVDRYGVPVVSHEIGQWCVYPKLDETAKYKGYLKARNFEIFADRLRDSGLLELAPAFLHASGRLQLLCYKEDIESALRTHRMGGFQLLGLQDFPGQGTALVGVVDPFWDDKGYTDAAEFSRFCGPTVPLARLKTRVIQSGAPFPITIDVAHFGRAPIASATLRWRIVATDRSVLASGDFPGVAIPLGNTPLDLRAAPVLTTDRPTAARLEVAIDDGARTIAENDWDIWVYPRRAAPGRAIGGGRIARFDTIDAQAIAHLERGGDALIGLPPRRIANFDRNPVKLGFSSIFWNTLWTERQAPTTLGILCDPKHPALADFPSDAHSNWHWWYLLHRAGALRLDVLPRDLSPIVRIVDDWFTARPLGLVIEARVGRGRAIVCGFGVDETDGADPVSLQLIASIEDYMRSTAFAPPTPVSGEQLRRLQA